MGIKAAVKGGWHLCVVVNRKKKQQRKQRWGKKTGMSKGLWIKPLGDEGSHLQRLTPMDVSRHLPHLCFSSASPAPQGQDLSKVWGAIRGPQTWGLELRGGQERKKQEVCFLG